jgi:hypothetical protein
MKIRAITNNDIALVAWAYDQKIPGCLGFAVHRTNTATNVEEPLPAWVGFRGEAHAAHERKTTEQWPIQKFNWRDLTAKHGERYSYRVVPMVGEPGALTPREDLELSSDVVSVSPERGKCRVYFNRGILSTQSLASQLPKSASGLPNSYVLRQRLEQPGDPLRSRLAGDALHALQSLLERADAEGGQCYCALYELDDVDLVGELVKRKNVHVILSNSSASASGEPDATNHAARSTLHEAWDGHGAKRIVDRMLVDGHIGHNKFVVYVGPDQRAKAVLSGSTNWTTTGLCAQSNNAIVIESESIAAGYLDYWKRLLADDADQTASFRARNRTQAIEAALDAGSRAKIWFSPNTERKTKPANGAATPVDLEEAFALIRGAQQAVLFLAFIPGTPSILDVVRETQLAKPALFVRGALTDEDQAAQYVDLFHRDGGEADARVVPALGIPDEFAWWERELYKLGHAVIHDKIAVIDPFSDDCAVITGSHNLGFKASYANDENLVIVRGDRAVAEAYTAHVLDVYDHYRWRFVVQEAARKGRLDDAWDGLDRQDRWQDKYFAAHSPTRKDREFWRFAN